MQISIRRSTLSTKKPVRLQSFAQFRGKERYSFSDKEIQAVQTLSFK